MVKPFVDLMTPSELHLAMTSGFSTISGSVLTGYIQLGIPASSLITASMMSIPASIAISKIVYPEDDEPVTLGRIVVDRGEEETQDEVNALHAFSNGAWLGLKIAGLILCNGRSLSPALFVLRCAVGLKADARCLGFCLAQSSLCSVSCTPSTDYLPGSAPPSTSTSSLSS